MRRLKVLTFAAALVILAVGAAGQANELDPPVTLSVSDPANGTHFVAGESPVVSVTLLPGMSKEDFSRLNLYLYGPQETTQTKTAVKLLNASEDRSTRPHHYIDLGASPDVVVNGNVLSYNLQAVSDEEPGTYTATVWSVPKVDSLELQTFPFVDFQIGTATVEQQIVEKEKCGQCHLGADSGKMYLHHIDPGYSPTGNPSLDGWPVRTCKSCHNTDGYAAYRDPEDSSVRVPDPIVNRVHGVHMGEHLENPRNIDPETGIFSDYTDVEFPADVRNCTYCHVDDRWKTSPSRLACGACHDNVWFGDPALALATAELHPGGQKDNDFSCGLCHPPDGNVIEGVKAPISVVHKIDPPAFKQTVELSMSVPVNGVYYVAGETPQVTITIKDAATGEPIDPATIVEPADSQNVADNEWRRVNLFVSGPREHTEPVLTAAAAHEDSGHYYANNDLRVRIDPNNEDPNVSRSATDITYQLGDVAGLEPGTYTAFVEIMPAAPLGGWAVSNFQVGTETEEQKICTNCTDCHDDTRMHAGYFAVQFDSDICKNCHDYENQLAGKTGWDDSNWGFGAAPLARRIHGVHYGHYLHAPLEVYANPDRFDASTIIFPQDVRNCTKCHADNPLWQQEPSRLACLSCHDSIETIFHGALMTFDPTWDEPYNGDEIETCVVCHGDGADFAVEKVHNISDPYVPPYPREPESEEH